MRHRPAGHHRRVRRLVQRRAVPAAEQPQRPRAGPPPGSGQEVELAVVLDLLDAACTSGAGVPGALVAVGDAIGGRRGPLLRRAGAALLLGAPWQDAWDGCLPGDRRVPAALRAAWEDGVPPGHALRGAAEAARRERHARAAEAAGRLGVRLVLPLGLCYLPAFLAVGLVPVLLSMADGALGG